MSYSGCLWRIPVSTVVDRLAEGDLTRSADVKSGDEVGQMARGLDTATARLREMIAAVASSAHTLAGSGEELTAVSHQTAASSEETSTQAGVVSRAADHISRNIQTLASGAEQMGASIGEISSNATEAARVAQEADPAVGATKRPGRPLEGSARPFACSGWRRIRDSNS